MTPVELSRTVLRAVRRAVDDGELSVAVPARAVVTSPGPGGCGDYATNIALQLARPAGRAPLQVAEILRPHLSGAAGVADVAITGPGFLNISLGAGAPAALAHHVLTQGARYGHSDVLAGQVVELRVPYDARAEVVADTLVRIVATQGGRAEVRHAEPVNLRPVPAPEDPAPLGPDAARWALLHPAPHDRPRTTAEHLVQRESNPLFRVRYAHARTRALSRNAAALGYVSDPSHVSHESREPESQELESQEHDLLAALGDYPHALRIAASHHTPDRLARHLVVTADALLAFQHTVLPLGDEKPSAAHRARLALAEAAGTVLAGGLSLLGISAPDYL
ncbi:MULTISPECIES: ArgS-related anticodon-binding protein NrtL [unclassified Streptomyces]|uniref:ArgS-related anticodon-binding protein NrtL n=1 Tax=unclassified Streptomyces TaxID=2593676 RepID=UPI002E812DF3|nr:DALR anticodon-binding domain-containing protein [Streptomyces sp. NBC_00589]WTI36259.1 DALR anticodon-binding domain-containing protein [Streptomyces sp. NBC_00775]WUB30066.1 DALR anticodon-binding domain-containing protein [Streptomyces sp. NBC_00589]